MRSSNRVVVALILETLLLLFSAVTRTEATLCVHPTHGPGQPPGLPPAQPDARNDYYSWPATLSAVTLTVLANDQAASGTLTLLDFTQPSHGTAVRGSNNTILYTAGSLNAGSDSFTYRVNDAVGQAAATVYIGVAAGTSSVDFNYNCLGGACTFTGTSDLPALRGFTYQLCPAAGGTCITSPLVSTTAGFTLGLGTWNVTITALSYSGASVSSTKQAVVTETNAKLQFSVDVSGGEKVGLSFDLLSIPWSIQDSYTIDWNGDGHFVAAFNTATTPVGQHVTHVYNEVGPKHIGIHMALSSGEVHDFYQWLDVHNNPPVPAFSVTTQSSNPHDTGRTFAVTTPPAPATAIDEQMESIVTNGIIPNSWVWDFGDGTSVTKQTSEAVQHQYVLSGTYTATLQVRDHLGAIGSATKQVAILGAAPSADFLFDCKAGLVCDLDAAADPVSIASYAWNFGDASSQVSETGPIISHSFPAAGRYTVSLTTTAVDTQQSSSSRYVIVTNPDPTPGLAFFAVTPCRLFDSRNVNGGLALHDASDTIVQVSGQCGVPADARVVVATVDAITPTGDGYFKVYDPTKPLPSGALSFLGGMSAWANNVFAPLSSDGRLAVRTATGGAPTTHLVIDVTGYFAGWSSSPVTPANGFARGPYAFAPGASLYDSTLTSPAMPLLPATPQLLKISTRSPGSEPFVPDGAAFLNLEIKDAPGAGYVTLYPSELPSKPGTSTVNLTPHVPVTNGMLMALSGRINDDVAMTYTGGGASTDYILTAAGYFRSDAPNRYHPVTPCRAVDTRDLAAQGPSRGGPGQWGFQVGGNCGVPASATAVFAYVTYVHPDVRSSIAVLTTPFIPETEVILAKANTTVGNGMIAALQPDAVLRGDFLTTFGDPGQAGLTKGDLVIDIYGYFTPDPSTSSTSAGVSQ